MCYEIPESEKKKGDSKRKSQPSSQPSGGVVVTAAKAAAAASATAGGRAESTAAGTEWAQASHHNGYGVLSKLAAALAILVSDSPPAEALAELA